MPEPRCGRILEAREVMMRGRCSGWSLLSCVALVLGAVGCSSGDSSPPASEGEGPARTDVEPPSTPAEEDISYRFSGAPDGMTVSAISADQVQTLSCPVGTCFGMCSDCAAAACRSMGGAEALCGRLARDCENTCACGPGGCGFPVCEANARICYEGPEGPGALPRDPGPETDPNPFDDSANDETPPSGGSATNGSGASTPLP